MSLSDNDGTIVDRDYVEKRVDDWKKRVSDLYLLIGNWLQGSGYAIKISGTIKFEMYEELMHRFGVNPIKMDIAAIYKGQQFVGKISPFGLWIIGANGAIELNTAIRTHKIIDIAEKFEKPNWMIVEREGFEENIKTFNREKLLTILRTEDKRIK